MKGVEMKGVEMKGLVVTFCVVAAVVGSAVVVYAAIPNDGGRAWKTNLEAYRLGFAAGGADMLARLSSSELRDPAHREEWIRHKLECLNRMSTLSVLRGAVEDRILQDRLPVPHGPSDVPAVASVISYVLGYYCDRSATVSRGIPESEAAYHAADQLRVAAGRISVYVTHDEYRAADNVFRGGYVAGAANMLRYVASQLQKEPADGVLQEAQKAGACVRSKYNKLSTLHRRLDAEVSKDVAGGHFYNIASTLYVLLVDCRQRRAYSPFGRRMTEN